MKLKGQSSKLKGSTKGQAPVVGALSSNPAPLGVTSWVRLANGHRGIGNL